MKLEFRAITNNDLNRESAVVISSTIPSAKYSCSGSSDMFWNGRTAIEGLSGSGGGAPFLSVSALYAPPRTTKNRTRFGEVLFLFFPPHPQPTHRSLFALPLFSF